MGFKCGIVGLPNVGKSTLFNALTRAGIEAANYPFCTIEPNVGIVPMPDPRLDAIAEIVRPQRVVATTMEFVDIAGLVAGASRGEGLGNKFLANIRETQAIAHVVRCFEHGDITHVSGRINPREDIEIINTELALADLEAVDRQLQRITKMSKSGDKEALAQMKLFQTVYEQLDSGAPVRALSLATEEHARLQQINLLTMKPTMYIANVAEDGFVSNPFLDEVNSIARQEKAVVVPVCAAIESEIAELPDDEKGVFLEDLGLSEPGLNRVIRAGYELLGLQTFFTAGEKEVHAWTIKIGTKSPQAAAVIHTDFEKGFIRAEVIGYQDFISLGGEHGAKEAGKWRLEGKDYVLQDGDVVHFRFNV